LEKDLLNKIWALLETIPDPEIPVLSVVDLGIVRQIEILNNKVHIQITPTYTACPAMQLITMNIHAALNQEGISHEIQTLLSPAWTTDWMSEKGKAALKAYGIAAPVKFARINAGAFEEEDEIACPRCDSHHTKKISEFGSTACKALYQCQDCKEPFDYFKCH
jgi:ring-1,2-phenylacetyl-CoA epoxidase subunit PaaD